jgi:predicted membrane protein
MVKAYTLYLGCSIVGRMVLMFYFGSFMIMWTLLILLLDVYLIRITYITIRVLEACTEEEREELRLAASQGRLPLPTAPSDGQRTLLRV